MAAGIGAIFRSPLGGSLFAVEVLYREDIESEGIVSVFTRTKEVILPVIDDEAERIDGSPPYCGLVLLDAIQPLLSMGEIERRMVIAADVMAPFVSVGMDETLDHVMAVFEQVGYPELPAVDATGKNRGLRSAGPGRQRIPPGLFAKKGGVGGETSGGNTRHAEGAPGPARRATRCSFIHRLTGPESSRDRHSQDFWSY